MVRQEEELRQHFERFGKVAFRIIISRLVAQSGDRFNDVGAAIAGIGTLKPLARMSARTRR